MPISRAIPKGTRLYRMSAIMASFNLPGRTSSSAAEEQPADADADRVEDGGKDQGLCDQRHHSPSHRTPDTPGMRGDAAVDAREIAHALRAGTGRHGRERIAWRRSGLRSKRTWTGKLVLPDHRLGLGVELIDEGFALAGRPVADPAGEQRRGQTDQEFDAGRLLRALVIGLSIIAVVCPARHELRASSYRCPAALTRRRSP